MVVHIRSYATNQILEIINSLGHQFAKINVSSSMQVVVLDLRASPQDDVKVGAEDDVKVGAENGLRAAEKVTMD